MNKYLFTLAIGVDDRPKRWGSISGNYVNLAHSLVRLGHQVVFALHPEVRIRKSFLAFEHWVINDHSVLDKLLAEGGFTHGFIWGGRLEADRETRRLFEARGVVPVFSELGWFPQAGTVYFDGAGTNAEVSFSGRRYPPCEARERRLFRRQRRDFYRRKAGLGWFASPPDFAIAAPDPRKPILVLLQDESDTNITLASPFRRMADFVDCLALQYPSCQFVVRPHPSARWPGCRRQRQLPVSSVDVYGHMPVRRWWASTPPCCWRRR